jgi:hypothetical protein
MPGSKNAKKRAKDNAKKKAVAAKKKAKSTAKAAEVKPPKSIASPKPRRSPTKRKTQTDTQTTNDSPSKRTRSTSSAADPSESQSKRLRSNKADVPPPAKSVPLDDKAPGDDEDVDSHVDSHDEAPGDEQKDDEDSHASSSTDSDDDPSDPPARHSGGSSEEEPALKPQRTAIMTRRRLTKGGEDKYWMGSTRDAVRDCAPHCDKAFLLYLPRTPENVGAKMMIEGDVQLKEMAATRGGVDAYSKEKAKFFNGHHRKAKSQLNRSILLALGCDGPYQMAMNVMSGQNGPMLIHPHLDHLKDIDGLRRLFKSDHLYLDAKVHRLWVGMFQSGVIEGMDRVSPRVKLDEIVDINYEAHARLEMVSRLSFQGYKTSYTSAALTNRAEEFRQIRKKVRKDRANNLDAAEMNRLSLTTDSDGETSRTQALGSGGLADTTDEEDNF